jgi:membrane-associated protein
MELLKQIVETVLHFSPEKVNELAQTFGWKLYPLLFAIIFAETGLVLIPFLPGDSLLFAVGAVAAHPDSPISLVTMGVLLVIAAVAGDAVNYAIGYRVGPAVFSSEKSRLLNRRHLNEAHEFYEKYGGKTIILARFIPIIRTFAPFVAGIGKMDYFKFALYNVAGGASWVVLCLVAGWFFGGFEIVQKRFELVIVAIVVISVLPAVVEFLRKRSPRGQAGSPRVTASAGEEATVAD